jgi:hypothetical protein
LNLGEIVMTTHQMAVPHASPSRSARGSLSALFARLFGRRELTSDEVLALWERQKLIDQLAAERHAAALRHYPIGRVF